MSENVPLELFDVIDRKNHKKRKNHVMCSTLSNLELSGVLNYRQDNHKIYIGPSVAVVLSEDMKLIFLL